MSQTRDDLDRRPTSLAYAGARVAVLGASGFIGRWVARALTAAGAEICLVVRTRSAAAPVLAAFGVRGTVFEADLAECDAIGNLFQEIHPSITFNLAGYGVDPAERDVAAATRINVELVEAVCEGAAQYRDPRWAGQHIVHAGSALEYGVASGNLAEDSEPMPTTVYGRSKLEGTRTLARKCLTLGLRGVTARLFAVYGPGEHRGRLLPSLLDAATRQAPLDLTQGSQRRDFTYVEDVADGLLRLGVAATEPGAIVNLATGRLTSVREFAETAARVLPIAPDHLRFGAVPARPEDMVHDEVAIARLIRLVGWSPKTSIEEGIVKTHDFAGSL